MRTAEDLALLLHEPDTGAPLVDSTSLPRALAGAVVLQLVLDGRAHLADGGRWRGTRLVVDDRGRTGDHVLDLALERLPDDASPKSAIEKLQGRVRDPLMAGLVHDGALRLEERALLGIPRSPRYPAADRTRRDAVVARLRAVLVDGAAPSRDDAALVALVRAVKAEHELLDAPRRELRDRSKVVAEGEWAGEAVRRAIADVHAAVAAAAGAGAVAASS
ncbi:GOLPH3/VPS74 family protein [Actinomycetospora lemnae]|uniref:GPP34 family phosphoprotein n=1 Tax=Actinomycetospora lemnae TaxID=3019891 RepID=A0ABT5SNR6_9PSEU|nr:GPP34 family phosphoprotein [Actinomycetospora sp. DW7H6]MDD7964485.1 GPP34 family phosphoprotein [Actinomycetospora sp. DW7H6]